MIDLRKMIVYKVKILLTFRVLFSSLHLETNPKKYGIIGSYG